MPSLDGAAPAMRASCLNVFDVATAMRGSPTRRSRPTTSAMWARACLRSSRTASGGGGSPRRKSRVSRPAPRGTDTATSGSSSVPDASSSEPPPMSSSRIRPLDHPNHRRAARKVMRASSSPDSTWISSPVSARTRASTCSPLVASRMADVAKAMISVAPLSSASDWPRLTKSMSCSTAASSTLPSAPRCSDRRSGIFSFDAGTGAAP